MAAGRSGPVALSCAAILGASVLAALGCGGGASTASGPAGGRAPATASTSAQALRLAAREYDGDGDNDSLGMGQLDHDGDATPTYGPIATTPERQAIVALLQRFYSAGAAGDAAKVCSLFYPLAVEGLVEEHDRGKGPASLRGSSCTQIVAKLLRRDRRKLTAKRKALTVPIIEVHAKRAWAVVYFGLADEEVVMLHRDRHTWSITSLLREDSQ